MIELQREGDVFVLRMKGGENRINQSFLDDFNQALDEVERSQGDVALVSTGEAKFYSNGLDLEGFQGSTPQQSQGVLTDLHHLLARLLVFPIATVAAVNGHAFAAGAMLFVISDEIIPETHSKGKSRSATFGVMVGFVVMMAMDNLLG